MHNTSFDKYKIIINHVQRSRSRCNIDIHLSMSCISTSAMVHMRSSAILLSPGICISLVTESSRSAVNRNDSLYLSIPIRHHHHHHHKYVPRAVLNSMDCPSNINTSHTLHAHSRGKLRVYNVNNLYITIIIITIIAYQSMRYISVDR